MTLNSFSDDISLSPLRKDLQSSSWASLRQDAMAALTVAFLTVPQAMAYAILAGLPITCGLFAAIYAACFASTSGSSRHLVVGPSNAIAILVQAGTSEILFSSYRHLTGADRDLAAVQILTQLTLLIGLFQVLVAGFKMGRVTQFVSHSVIIGYMAGTATAVTINQLFTFLGVARLPGVHSMYENAAYLLTHMHQAHLMTLLTGIGSLVFMVILKKMDKRIPAGVLMLVGAALAVHYLDLTSYSLDSGLADPYADEEVQTVRLVGDNGELFELIPLVQFPYFDTGIMNSLLPMAFALALLGIMETISISKSIAASSGQRLSINQEIFGIGFANLVSSFIGAMPVAGSAIRSSVNYRSGAQTRFAAILNAIFVWLIIFVLGFYINRIPLAALAALLLYNVGQIVNVKQLKICLKATSADAFVLWTTFLSCLFFSLDIAFYIGIAISITLYLNKSAMPQVMEYEMDESGELRNLDLTHCAQHRAIRVIKVEGELFFGAADIFQRTLKAIAEDDTETTVIILQLKNARDMDATACLALHQLHDYLKGSGRHLIACGLTHSVWEVLSDSGLVQLIGKDNIFVFDERQPHHNLQMALQRAKQLASQLKHVPEDAPILEELPEKNPAET